KFTQGRPQSYARGKPRASCIGPHPTKKTPPMTNTRRPGKTVVQSIDQSIDFASVCCCTGRERRQQQGRAADCAVDRIASFEAAAEPGQDIGLRLEIKQSISSLIGWEIRYRGKTSGRRGDT